MPTAVLARSHPFESNGCLTKSELLGQVGSAFNRPSTFDERPRTFAAERQRGLEIDADSREPRICRCYSRETMKPQLSQVRSGQELLDANRRFYDMLWAGARLVEPQRFNTWPLVNSLLPGGMWNEEELRMSCPLLRISGR